MRHLLALLDPLLGRASLVIEAYDRAIGKLEIRDDEPDAREEFAGMVLHFRHDP